LCHDLGASGALVGVAAAVVVLWIVAYLVHAFRRFSSDADSRARNESDLLSVANPCRTSPGGGVSRTSSMSLTEMTPIGSKKGRAQVV
jgi:hypothetical protein